MPNHETQNNKGEIVIYEPQRGSTAIEVKLQDETVWLTQMQIVNLFQKRKSMISYHISSIFKERELERSATVRKYRTVQKEGNRVIDKKIEYYNLDVIISVGYRVKSKRGTQFRIWATSVLRDHLVKGYTLNRKRLQEDQRKQMKERVVRKIAHISYYC